jgi:hypothetical protein
VPRRRSDDPGEARQRLIEGVAVANTLDDPLCHMGRHLPDCLVVQVAIPDDNHLSDSHVHGATRRRTDIPGKLRPFQHDGHVIEIRLHKGLPSPFLRPASCGFPALIRNDPASQANVSYKGFAGVMQ